MLIALGCYHLWAMPRSAEVHRGGSLAEAADTLKDVVVTFFQKPGIWLAVAFIVLFRAGEGQVQTIGRLFLLDKPELGGLGLSTDQVGIAYGTFATLAFIGGSILGGYFAAWRGLKKAMFPLILAMNVPNLTFWYLNTWQPTDLYLITATLSVEMLGYGVGFTGLILYIMQVVAPGKYPTAHYALGTGIMQLGFVLFQMMSGKIQSVLGYHHFFLWCVVSAIPVLVLSLVVAIPGKDEAQAISGEPRAATG
jgi:PAT family beta-lactamase induction signal transducer AmpG